MTDHLTYNPRDCQYKIPYGAVAAGSVVWFALRPARGEGFSHAVLLARLEGRENETVTQPLLWTGTELGRDKFSGTLDTGNYVGLVWYSFVLTGEDGRETKLGEYQLTVYQPESVPQWFGEGVTYQIFPDRFCRTTLPAPRPGRTIHQEWEEEPEWRPDETGEVRNRDFFGGSLNGIIEKLSYLAALGITTLYLCPVFEGAENHRYGTADYEQIDPMLGTKEDFSALCAAAHGLGMRVLLDGVFNHIGFVSRYFNGDGSYPDLGAYQSQSSPYADWFRFTQWPEQYEAWWGIYSLPAVREEAPSYRDYIFGGEASIVRRWLRAGADGWRLDVVDELPDDFVAGIHRAARAEQADAVILGEVWEDGTTKVAYGVRRKHLLGGHCDGLMNYPFRNAAVSYLLGGDAGDFMERMETLRENYPPSAFDSAMNFLGTHDTPRILTLLGVGRDCADLPKAWRSEHVLSAAERERGVNLLRLGAMLLFAFPGSPMIYYGDEAGMEGFEDPFNRRTYPWGREDSELKALFGTLGTVRKRLAPLRKGGIRYHAARGQLLAFTRTWAGETVLCALNSGGKNERFMLPWTGMATDLLTGESYLGADGMLEVRLPPRSGALLYGQQSTEK